MSTFIPDQNKGTLSYSTGKFDTRRILPVDHMVDSSAYGTIVGSTLITTSHGAGEDGVTFRSLDPLKVVLGKNQRALIKYHIHYSTTNNAKAKFQVHTSTTDCTSRAAITGIAPDDATFSDLKVTTNGVFNYSVNVNGTNGYIEIDMILVNDQTINNVNLQYAQITDHADNLIVRAGSYVEVLKF